MVLKHRNLLAQERRKLLIGIDTEGPIMGRQAQRKTLLSDVTQPIPMLPTFAKASGNFLRTIAAAGIDNENLVCHCRAAFQTARQITFFIERNQAKGNFHDFFSLAASSNTTSVSSTLRSRL